MSGPLVSPPREPPPPPPPRGRDYTPEFFLDQVWSNRDDILFDLRQLGVFVMMVLTIKKSWPRDGGRRGAVILACENYGVHKKRKKPDIEGTPLIKRRQLRSKLRGCSFALRGDEDVIEQWSVPVICGQHNHDLPKSLLGHAFVGRLKLHEKEQVGWWSATTTPSKPVMMGLLAENPDSVTLRRTLYNTKAELKRIERGDRTVSQYTHALLADKNYFCNSRRRSASDDKLKDIFVSHPDSRHLLSHFPYVIMMD